MTPPDPVIPCPAMSSTLSLTLAELKLEREKYSRGVSSIRRSMSVLESDLHATSGALQYIEKKIAELEAKPSETVAPAEIPTQPAPKAPEPTDAAASEPE